MIDVTRCGNNNEMALTYCSHTMSPTRLWDIMYSCQLTL